MLGLGLVLGLGLGVRVRVKVRVSVRGDLHSRLVPIPEGLRKSADPAPPICSDHPSNGIRGKGLG